MIISVIFCFALCLFGVSFAAYMSVADRTNEAAPVFLGIGLLAGFFGVVIQAITLAIQRGVH